MSGSVQKKLILLAISTARTREGEFSIFTSYVWKVVLIDDGLLLWQHASSHSGLNIGNSDCGRPQWWAEERPPKMSISELLGPVITFTLSGKDNCIY